MRTGRGDQVHGERICIEQKNHVAMERVKGIEPSSSAWEAAALPLSYTRALYD